jgi:hypothetical protein
MFGKVETMALWPRMLRRHVLARCRLEDSFRKSSRREFGASLLRARQLYCVRAAEVRDPDDAIAAEVGVRPAVVTDVQLIEPPKPDMETVGRFMLACLSRSKGAEAAGGEVYARYLRWCGEQAAPLAALAPNAFAEQFAARCLRAGIRTRRGDGRVYCLDVQVAA